VKLSLNKKGRVVSWVDAEMIIGRHPLEQEKAAEGDTGKCK
jgi:hypothetical protein